MSGLKFTLSDVRSFLPENLFGFKKSYIQACCERDKDPNKSPIVENKQLWANCPSV